MIKHLWLDEGGAVLSAELVLVSTLLFCGVALGVNELRNAILQELADTASMIGSVDQSYSYSGPRTKHGHCSGSNWTDSADDCDNACAQGSAPNSRDVVVCVVNKLGGE